MNEHVIHDYIAGALAGSAGLVIGHPLDTTKVQLQTQLHGNQYKGIYDAASNINRQGLVKGFFRGMSWPVFSYGVINSVFFGVYGNSLKYLDKGQEKRKSSYLNIYLAGCVGGAAQLIPAIPIDYIKVVLQSQIPHTQKNKGSKAVQITPMTYFKGPVDCTRHIVRTSGIRGLYKGGVTMFWRDVPSFGLYSLTYEYLTAFIQAKGWSDSKGFFADFIAGGCAGSVAWMSIIPIDVAKSRYQADLKNEFKGPLDCAVKSYREEGIRVFFRGALVTCFRGFPVNAVSFVVYSQTMKYFENRHIPGI